MKSVIFTGENKPFQADQGANRQEGLDCRRALADLFGNIRRPEVKLIELKTDDETERGKKSLADQAKAGDIFSGEKKFHGCEPGGRGLID